MKDKHPIKYALAGELSCALSSKRNGCKYNEASHLLVPMQSTDMLNSLKTIPVIRTGLFRFKPSSKNCAGPKNYKQPIKGYHFKFHTKKNVKPLNVYGVPCEILMQFDRLYFTVGHIEAEIWDFWSFGPSRALPDIWTGKTHLGFVLRCP